MSSIDISLRSRFFEGAMSGRLIIGVFALCSILASCSSSNPSSPTKGTIQGRVLGARSVTPIANAVVSTTPATASVVTDATGAYTLTNVPNGTYLVAAVQPDSGSGSASVSVTDGSTVTADILLGKTSTGGGGTGTPLITDGLVAYYPLSGSGIDKSGNGFNGNVGNLSPTKGFDGVDGSALMFPQTDTIWVVSDHSFERLPMTVAFWLKSSDFLESDGPIIGKYLNPDLNGWCIFRESHNLSLFFGPDASQYLRNDYSAFPNDGDWHHVVYTLSSSGLGLFIDGKLVSTSKWNSSYAVVDTPFNFTIGGFATTLRPPPSLYSGAMDDVYVFSRILTLEEIQKLHQGK